MRGKRPTFAIARRCQKPLLQAAAMPLPKRHYGHLTDTNRRRCGRSLASPYKHLKMKS
jgi:hypothetical protein